ncbi:sialidase-2-like isoform X2 [Carettochelys insculpta]|uniref:sialidase-2-like isoform X2 n=1 Tax=Carettochelys insculpta TaxID=44489 RepID=UPI003EBE4836
MSPESVTDVLQQVVLFQTCSWRYRIPALLYIQQHGTILAFAEEREGGRDETAKVIVMRRGTYDGDKCRAEWDLMKKIVEAQLQGYRSMSPCPVYDEVDKKVILFFIAVKGNISEGQQIKERKNRARLCQVTSTDCGCSWSSVTTLTEEASKEWATFAVGPGHGLQLNNETQSLVIPANAYWILDAKNDPSQHPFCFVSDDHGQTCTWGKYLAKEVAGECQVAELSSGEKRVLYCNARSQGPYRIQAVSNDDGKNFHSSQEIKELVEPTKENGCQGSIIVFPRAPNVPSDQKWMLYSHPTDNEWQKYFGVYLNKDPLKPEEWSKPVVLYKGKCAYSDLQYMGVGPDSSPLFGCLFEHDYQTENEKIVFCMFTLKQVFPSEFKASEDRFSESV